MACNGIELEPDVAEVTASKENNSVHLCALGGKSIQVNKSVDALSNCKKIPVVFTSSSLDFFYGADLSKR